MEAYIVKAYRSAVGKAKKGGFRNFRSDDLAVRIIDHMLKDTPELDPALVDDCIVGCANPEGEQGITDRSDDLCTGIRVNRCRA